MASASGLRISKQPDRYRDFVTDLSGNFMNTLVEPSAMAAELVLNPGPVIGNTAAGDTTRDNNEGLTNNTGMIDVNSSDDDVKVNANSTVQENYGVKSAVPGTLLTPRGAEASAKSVNGKPNITSENNSIETNAIKMAIRNESEISKISEEIKSFFTILEAMRAFCDIRSLIWQTSGRHREQL